MNKIPNYLIVLLERIYTEPEKLRLANNEIDRLDREIKQREFQKKPYQEIIDSFN